MIRKLITVAGVASTLGFAAPAFADWYQPAPPPVYGTPVQQPGWHGEWRHEGRDYGWRRHEAEERYRRWRHYEWQRRHHGGYYPNYDRDYYQGW